MPLAAIAVSGNRLGFTKRAGGAPDAQMLWHSRSDPRACVSVAYSR